MFTFKNYFNIKSLAVGMVMMMAAGMTIAITPSEKIADRQQKVNLDLMIPKSFANWHVDESIAPVQVDPVRKAIINKIYNQTLSRTYTDNGGNYVMLSIAYGGDQSDSLQVHFPEACYTAQGFQVIKTAFSELTTRYGKLPIKRLFAVQGSRSEPITYWVTVGDKVARSDIEQKLEKIKYGLTGKIPDGMLFRVSTISENETTAYAMQDKFVDELLSSLSQKDRARLTGVFGA